MAMVHDTPIPTQVTPGDAAPKPPRTTTVRPAWPPYAHRTVEAIPGRRRMFYVESSDPKEGPHTVDLEELTCTCLYFVMVRSIFPPTDPLCVDTHMLYARDYEITLRDTRDPTLDALIERLPNTAPVVLIGGKIIEADKYPAATPSYAAVGGDVDIDVPSSPNGPSPRRNAHVKTLSISVTCPSCGKTVPTLYHGQCGVCRLQGAF